ncbi:MAG: hypothetical protein AB8B53_09085 [Flavobacteriales bacterium]
MEKMGIFPNFRMKPKAIGMLEFCKKVLEKVSFDKYLFKKELQKAIRWVKADELEVLRRWCLIKFGGLYRQLIEDSFQKALPA